MEIRIIYFRQPLGQLFREAITIIVKIIAWLRQANSVAPKATKHTVILNVGYLRHNMSPMHLEAELFLFVNKKFWDAKIVSQLASNHVDL